MSHPLSLGLKLAQFDLSRFMGMYAYTPLILPASNIRVGIETHCKHAGKGDDSSEKGSELGLIFKQLFLE